MSRLDSKNSKERRPNAQWPKLNQLLFDFGMSDEKLEEDVEYVKGKIVELDRQFDLGLFAVAFIYHKMNRGFINGSYITFINWDYNLVLVE